MRRHSCSSPFLALRYLSLALVVGALAGCGGSTPSETSLSLPPDATFNTAVRSGGYTITDLGPGKAVTLNSQREVLGSTTYAYLWANGTRHYLGVLGTDKGGSEAISLNDSGQALGYSYSVPRIPEGGDERHPFVWRDGVFTPVSVGSGSAPYRPIKINNPGQVLLERYGNPNPEYAVWKDGQSTPVAAVGINGNPLRLVTLNNNGSFLGAASDSGEQFQETPTPSRTYLVKNGQVTDVGFLPNRLNTVPLFLSDNDAIVGVGFAPRPDDLLYPHQSYVWQNGVITGLTGFPGEFLMRGFSNTGQIVGYLSDPSSANRSACRYDLNTRTLVNLNATVGSAAGWKLDSAAAINDVGQIIGEGQHNGKSRAYLLTPLP